MASQTFRSLQHRNARLYFAGLATSYMGAWIQLTAQVLLVRKLGGSGTELGFVAAAQYAPMLLLGLWAGTLVDRHDRKRWTFWCQSGMAAQAFVLAALDLSGSVTIPVVYVLSVILGIFSAFDAPARRGLGAELVPPTDLTNVFSLTSAVMGSARVVGPAVGALLVTTVGTGWCFLVNGCSFAVLLLALVALDRSRMYPPVRQERSARPVRDGLRAIWGDAPSRRTMIVMVVVATLVFNFPVALPLLVTDDLHADDSVFGLLLSVVSVGSVIGSLSVARRVHVGERAVAGYTGAIAICGVALALAPNVVSATLLCVPFGVATSGFVAATNAALQTRADVSMRSRVLALHTVAFVGSTPIGGPITGAIGDWAGGRWAILYGAVSAAACAVWMVASRRADDPRRG